MFASGLFNGLWFGNCPPPPAFERIPKTFRAYVAPPGFFLTSKT